MNTPSSDCEYDVVIVGGGMVGSMLAALLAEHSSMRIAVLEREQPAPFEPGTTPDYDIRVSALSIATQRLFESARAWQGVTSRRACPYSEMLVWDGEAEGSTHFKADDIGASHLGHIVENRVIQLALLDVLTNNPQVDYRCPAQLQQYTVQGDHVVVQLEGDDSATTLKARLLVGADGARSAVRELAGIEMPAEPYTHHALVATVDTELEQQNITWQRFKPTGPEALLPLCGSRASMVWYHDAEEVQRLKALSDDEFIDALMTHFPQRMGRIVSVNERASFPIIKAHARRYISPRLALLGDAAHTVHPLAGQGVNLGMLDAGSLAELLVEAHVAGQDIGRHRVLRRYERWRRGDNAMMIGILDGFYHAFKPQPQMVQTLRSTALRLADHTGPIKSMIMQYAMGTTGDLPVYAREVIR